MSIPQSGQIDSVYPTMGATDEYRGFKHWTWRYVFFGANLAELCWTHIHIIFIKTCSLANQAGSEHLLIFG